MKVFPIKNWDINRPDLIPFPFDNNEYINSFDFWRKKYREHAGDVRQYYYNVIDQQASLVTPTPQFPFSITQLGIEKRYAANKSLEDPDYYKALLLKKPKYSFVEIGRAFDSSENFAFALHNSNTNFIPWNEDVILHWLLMFIPSDEIHVSNIRKLTDANKQHIRGLLLKHWRKNELLRTYMSVTYVDVSANRLQFIQSTTLFNLMFGYYTFGGKEVSVAGQAKFWSYYVLLHTYKFLNLEKAISYSALIGDMIENSREYKLYSTSSGILLLKNEHATKIRLNNFHIALFNPPSGWTKSAIIKIYEVFFNSAKDKTKAESKKYFTILGQSMVLYVKIMRYFLNYLFRSHNKFAVHVSLNYGNLTSLRSTYLRTNDAKILKGVKKSFRPSKKKIIDGLMAWSRIERHAKEIISQFVRDSRSLPEDIVAIIDSYTRYQKYMVKRFKKLILPSVLENPQQSQCDDNRRATPYFISPDNAQEIWELDFTPDSPMNGVIKVHSVGSGKTCGAIKGATPFVDAGFDIVWVTKTSLKNQVLKNHVSQICDVLIKRRYEYLRVMEGDDKATQWLKNLPSQTSFQAVLKLLKELGMNWINMSYRQLSNALQKKNDIGRSWFKKAALFPNSNGAIDPLRRKLIYIDEAHKIFTGELDTTELPNVQIMLERFQHSYKVSGFQRCRLCFLTATPMVNSMLPFVAMINMMSNKNMYPMMQTFDPEFHGSYQERQTELNRIVEFNRRKELKIAENLFPDEYKFQQVQAKVDDEDVSPQQIQNYFSSKGILGVMITDLRKLRNNMTDFWSNTFGIVSYYNISADYSRFPRTQFKTIIIPSATRLQERLIASTLTKKKSLKYISNRVRRISNWAVFQRVSNPPIMANNVDTRIIEHNRTSHYFEPTLDDLESRKQAKLEEIALLKVKTLDDHTLATINNLRKKVKEFKVVVNEREQSLTKIGAQLSENKDEAETARLKKKFSTAKGLYTKKAKVLAKMTGDLRMLEAEYEYFDEMNKAHIASLQNEIIKIDYLHKKLADSGRGKRVNRTEIKAFIKAKESESSGYSSSALSSVVDDMGDDDDAEIDEVVEVKDADLLQSIPLAKEGNVYTMKTWSTLPSRPKFTKPAHPSSQWFDLPTYFNAPEVKRLLPLYSPKAQKLVEQIVLDDIRDMRERGFLGKRMIYCEDIYAIRAVGAALSAYGWTFGMSLRKVQWIANYYDAETGEKLSARKAGRTAQLTWLPDVTVGQDFNRFLVLTKSKLGGPSGSTMNPYTIQQIGASGSDGTYNHIDNAKGKNWRIIIIDRNFMEGIDLPSTYADLFDPVLSRASQTQIVGRISRFCGMRGIPFDPVHGGWPQTVYRYGLKFHTLGLNMTPSQSDRLSTVIMSPGSAFQEIIPEQYIDGFIQKVEKDLFSPLELRIILDSNMEIQRLRKRSLDTFDTMLKRSNAGYLLYEPAMRNVIAFEEHLKGLLEEESETIQEYREQVLSEDDDRKEQIKYNLRNHRADQKKKYQMKEGRIFVVVKLALARSFKNKDAKEWETEEKIDRFVNDLYEKLLNDGSYEVTPPSIKLLVKQMLSKRLEMAGSKEHNKREKAEKKIMREAKKIENAAKKLIKQRFTKIRRVLAKLRKDGKGREIKKPEYLPVLMRIIQTEVPSATEQDVAPLIYVKSKAKAKRKSIQSIISEIMKILGISLTQFRGAKRAQIEVQVLNKVIELYPDIDVEKLQEAIQKKQTVVKRLRKPKVRSPMVAQAPMVATAPTVAQAPKTIVKPLIIDTSEVATAPMVAQISKTVVKPLFDNTHEASQAPKAPTVAQTVVKPLFD